MIIGKTYGMAFDGRNCFTEEFGYPRTTTTHILVRCLDYTGSGQWLVEGRNEKGEPFQWFAWPAEVCEVSHAS